MIFMKKQRKKFEKPLKPWERARIEQEKLLLQKYGLRRKIEIWKAESILRKFRRLSRELAAKKDKKQEQVILEKLQKLGLIQQNAKLDDVLALTIENILDRRLQTLVQKKGLANTLKQARQMIVHGRVAVDNKRAKWPSMLVTIEQEGKINLYNKNIQG